MELPLLLLVLCLLPLLGLSLSVAQQDPGESFTINNPEANIADGSGVYDPAIPLPETEEGGRTFVGNPRGAEAKPTDILQEWGSPESHTAKSHDTADDGGAVTEASIKGKEVADINRKSDVDEDKSEMRYRITVIPLITESDEYRSKLRPVGTRKERATTLPFVGHLQRTTVQPEVAPEWPLWNKDLPSVASSASSVLRDEGTSEASSEPSGAVPENDQRTLEASRNSLGRISDAKTDVTTEYSKFSQSTDVEKPLSNTTPFSATAVATKAALTGSPTAILQTLYKSEHSYQQTTTQHAMTRSSRVNGVATVTKTQIDTSVSDINRGTEEQTPSAPPNTLATGTRQGLVASHDPDLETSSTVAPAERNEEKQNSTIHAKGEDASNSTTEASQGTSDSAITSASTTEGLAVSITPDNSVLPVTMVHVTQQPGELEQQSFSKALLKTGYVTTLTSYDDKSVTEQPLDEAASPTSTTAGVATEMPDTTGTVTASASPRELSIDQAAISQSESTIISTQTDPRGLTTETAGRNDITLTPLQEAVSMNSSTSQNKVDVTIYMQSTTRSVGSDSETTVQSSSTEDKGHLQELLGQQNTKSDTFQHTENPINSAGVSNATEVGSDHADAASTNPTVAEGTEVSMIMEELSSFRVSTGIPGTQTAKSHFSAMEGVRTQEYVVTESSLTVPTEPVQTGSETAQPIMLNATGTTVIRKPVTTDTSARTAAATPSLPSTDSDTFPTSSELVATLFTVAEVNITDSLPKTDSPLTSVRGSTVAVTSVGPLVQLGENSLLAPPAAMSTTTQTVKNLPSFDPTIATVRANENTALLQSTSTRVKEDGNMTLQTLMPDVPQTDERTTLLPPSVVYSYKSSEIPTFVSEQPNEDATHSSHTPSLLPVDEKLDRNTTLLLETTASAQQDVDVTVPPTTLASIILRNEDVTLLLPVSIPTVAQPDENSTLSSPPLAATPSHENTTLPITAEASTIIEVDESSTVLQLVSASDGVNPDESLTQLSSATTVAQIDKDTTLLLPVTVPTLTQLSENSTLSSPTIVNVMSTTPLPTYTTAQVDKSLKSMPSVPTSTTVHPNKNSTLFLLLPTSKTTQLNNSSVLRGPPRPSTDTPNCIPLEPPRSLSHEFRLVFETSMDFSWEQIEVLEHRIQYFLNDTPCSENFARTAFALGPPHVLSWTNPSINSTWCDRAAVNRIFHSMRDPSTTVPTAVMTGTFLPEFHVISVQLQLRGACLPKHDSSLPAMAGAMVGIVLAAVLLAGLLTLLWKMLRTMPRSRKMDVTPPAPEDSFDLKQRRPMLLPGEARASAGGSTPHKSPRAKPNPPFVVDTDFCYINPNFLEAVKPSPPPPPPYRRPLDRRVRSLEAVLPARPLHATLGNRSLGAEVTTEQEELNCTSSSSGVESDVQHSGEGGK